LIRELMNPKPKMTRQGIRDLNYYGPKPPKAPAIVAPVAAGGERGQSRPGASENSDAPSAASKAGD
jgi:hypothetical protein